MASVTTASPRSKLLYRKEEGDSYFSPNKPSYYKRSNLLVNTQSTSSFRQKYHGFRTRSSSYTSIDDEKKIDDDNLITPSPATSSIFSRKNLGMTAERSSTAPSFVFSANKQDRYYNEKQDYDVEEEDDNDDENTFFAKKTTGGAYSRKNFHRSSSTSSWTSSVLRAVGVKSR
jgi:hypothetical protein